MARIYDPTRDWQGWPQDAMPGLCLSLERVDGEAQLVEIPYGDYLSRWTGAFSSAPAQPLAVVSIEEV